MWTIARRALPGAALLRELCRVAAQHDVAPQQVIREQHATALTAFEHAVTAALTRTDGHLGRGQILDFARAARRGRYARAERVLGRLDTHQRADLEAPLRRLIEERSPDDSGTWEGQIALVRRWSVGTAIPWLTSQADLDMALASPGLYLRWNSALSTGAALATYRLFVRSVAKTSVFGSIGVLEPQGQREDRIRPLQWPTWLAVQLNRELAFEGDWHFEPACPKSDDPVLPDPVQCFIGGEPRTVDQPGIGSSEAARTWICVEPTPPPVLNAAAWGSAAESWRTSLPAEFETLSGRLLDLTHGALQADGTVVARSLQLLTNEAHRLGLASADAKVSLHYARARASSVDFGARAQSAQAVTAPLAGSARLHAIFQRASDLIAEGSDNPVPLFAFLQRLWEDPVVRAAARADRVMKVEDCACRPQRAPTFGVYWMIAQDGRPVVNAWERDPLCAAYRWWDLIDDVAAEGLGQELDMDLASVTVVTHGADWAPGQEVSGNVRVVPWPSGSRPSSLYRYSVAVRDGRLTFMDADGEATLLIYSGLLPAARHTGVFRLFTLLSNPWHCVHPLWNDVSKWPGGESVAAATEYGGVLWRRPRWTVSVADLPHTGTTVPGVAAWSRNQGFPEFSFFRWSSADGLKRSKPLFVPASLPIVLAAELNRRPTWANFLYCEEADPVPGESAGGVEELFTMFVLPEFTDG